MLFKKEGFEDDYVKVLEELALHMDGSKANVVIELYSRKIYETVLEFSKKLGIVDSHIVLKHTMVHITSKIVATKVKLVAI